MFNPAQIDSMMYVIRPKGWLALGALVGFVLIALIWSVVDTVPLTVSGDGILLSPGGILDVVSSTPGLLKDYHVHPGDIIHQGQVVATLDQSELQLRLEEAKRERDLLLEQKSKTQEFQVRQTADRQRLNAGKRRDLEQNLAALREQLVWINDRERGLKTLYDKNIITRGKYIENIVDKNKLEQSISKAESDVRHLAAEEELSRIQGEKEILDIDNKISAATIKIDGIKSDLQRETKVISPYTGTVVELYVNVGEVVSRGSPLFSVVPDAGTGHGLGEDRLVAIVYVSSADGKKVKPGMQAQIIPVIIKRTEYGGIIGHVRTVADIPSSSAGMLHTLKNKDLINSLAGGASPYEVRIALQPDGTNVTGYHWTSRPPNLSISPGTLCNVDIVVLHIHPITLLIPALKPWLPDEVL